MAKKKPKPRWIGDLTLTETPDSPTIDEGLEETTITRTYEGPYDRCIEGRKRKGTKLKADGEWTFVSGCNVKKMEGGRGRLTIVGKQRLGSVNAGGGGGGGGDDGGNDEDNPNSALGKKPIIEIEWVRVDKPLGEAKVFKDLTDEQWGAINSWLKIKEWAPLQYSQFKYPLNADGDWKTDFDNWTLLTDLALKYAQKIRRGTDSFMAFYPVVRVTNYYNGKPTTGGCGKIGNPAGGGAPAGYQWVKTADRAIRQDNEWTRVREWTGTDVWDEDLYGTIP